MGDSTEGSRVLVVDDEPNIVELISMALRYQGFAVETAASGREAIAAVGTFKPQLIVLDVMLGDMEGFEVAERLGAQRAGVPIIFLTARDSTEDKVRGLSGGGDDYMTKPFSLEELVARIRTILRRTGQAAAESGRLVFADLELDEESREVTRAGAPIELTATEYRLLRYLMLNPRRVLTRAQLLDHVWNYDFGGDGRVLETYISYLRKKLDDHGPSLIRTVRGVGYALAGAARLMSSLRTRVLASVLVLAAAGLIALGAVTYAEQQSFLQGRLDQEVRSPARPSRRRSTTPASGRAAARAGPDRRRTERRSRPAQDEHLAGGPHRGGPPNLNLPPGTYGQRRASGAVLGHVLISYGQPRRRRRRSPRTCRSASSSPSARPAPPACATARTRTTTRRTPA